jgi:membrane protein implicated in regulation of membrane protease activity
LGTWEHGLQEAPVPTFVRYLLLESPGWLLAGLVAAVAQKWLGLSTEIAATFVSLWVAKDLLLYPWLKDALAGEAPTQAEKLLGRTAVVVDPLTPRGIVRLGAELWRAEASPREAPIAEGRPVRVIRVRGLTLVVVETS